MKTDNTPTKFRELPSRNVTVVRTSNNHVTVIDSGKEVTATVTLRESQAVKSHKLLSMPGAPIPAYQGDRVFFLAENTPTTEEYTPHPVLKANDDDVVLAGSTDQTVLLNDIDQNALCTVLAEWDFTMESFDGGRSVISLPAMIQLREGIDEPLLHVNYDHVLEHHHQATGYWSPEKEQYVVQH